LIDELLEAVRQETEAADATEKRDRTTVVTLMGSEPLAAHQAVEFGVNLRVLRRGRVGYSGSTTGRAQEIAAAALESATEGEELALLMPAPAPLAIPRTSWPETAELGAEDLVAIGRLLAESLPDHHECRITVERSTGSVQVANLRGVDHCYQASSVVLAVTKPGPGDSMIKAFWAGLGSPSQEEVASLVQDVTRQSDWSADGAMLPPGRFRALLSPAAFGTLMLPIRQALRGKLALEGRSPFAGHLGSLVASPLVTVVDEPLLDDRTGSRPLDDEGVSCRRMELIRDGVLQAMIYDLETACRIGVPATGHGRRSTFGKPQAAYSNLVVSAGDGDLEQMMVALGDGIVIERLGGRAGGTLAGRFELPVELGWKVTEGKAGGRLAGMTIAGDVYRLIHRVIAVGGQLEWRGSLGVPWIALDGVELR